MIRADEIAARFGLRRVSGGLRWAGACPACGYRDGLRLDQREGRALWWCASCTDKAFWSRMTAFGTTLTACGTSRKGTAIFVAVDESVASYLPADAVFPVITTSGNTVSPCAPGPKAAHMAAMMKGNFLSLGCIVFMG